MVSCTQAAHLHARRTVRAGMRTAAAAVGADAVDEDAVEDGEDREEVVGEGDDEDDEAEEDL